jgi:hypothetical protein
MVLHTLFHLLCYPCRALCKKRGIGWLELAFWQPSLVPHPHESFTRDHKRSGSCGALHHEFCAMAQSLTTSVLQDDNCNPYKLGHSCQDSPAYIAEGDDSAAMSYQGGYDAGYSAVSSHASLMFHFRHKVSRVHSRTTPISSEQKCTGIAAVCCAPGHV